MTGNSGLTKGRVVSLVRLFSVISLLLIAAAIALQFAPLKRPPSPSELVNATVRQSTGEGHLFTSYSAMLGERENPFKLGQVNRAEVRFQQVEQAPVEVAPSQPQAPPTPPVPQPDTEGLNLVGTMPGSRYAFALFHDEQSGLVQTIALGEAVRNSVLSQVFDDRVELTLADQKAELSLAQIAGGVAEAPVAASPQQAETPSRPRRKAGGKPSLGLSGHMLSPADMERLGVNGGSGLLITGVRRSDGLIQIDDVILQADGRRFSSTREFVALMADKGIGAAVELNIKRKSQNLSVTIMLL